MSPHERVNGRARESQGFVVETTGLTKRFGDRVAVADVDLRIPRGMRRSTSATATRSPKRFVSPVVSTTNPWDSRARPFTRSWGLISPPVLLLLGCDRL